MQAEIITIGDEILIGQIVDSNSAWIAQRLNETGITIYQITSISDNKEHILSALKQAGSRSDLVLITGGLGPTKDDITKEILCEFFDTKLVFHQPSFEDIKVFVKSRNSVLNELNKKQAEIPENCKAIRNLNGTAPGMWFEKDGKVFISMPGVPYEMKAMMADTIIPGLQAKFKTSNIVHKTILVHGLPEAVLAEKLDNWEEQLPDFLKLAYLPSPGLIRLRFSAYGVEPEIVEKEIVKQVEELKKIVPDNIVGLDKQKLEEEVGILLKNNKLTISTAESCTGGRIASLITSVSGSSNYYLGSIVAYSNEVKTNSLGVSEQNIINFGVVSKQVIEEMARGVKEKLKSDFSIATSGIAGPTGGTDEKPVGTTWISVSGPKKTISEKFQFAGEREQIIDKAARSALNLLRLEILNYVK